MPEKKHCRQPTDPQPMRHWLTYISKGADGTIKTINSLLDVEKDAVHVLVPVDDVDAIITHLSARAPDSVARIDFIAHSAGPLFGMVFGVLGEYREVPPEQEKWFLNASKLNALQGAILRNAGANSVFAPGCSVLRLICCDADDCVADLAAKLKVAFPTTEVWVSTKPVNASHFKPKKSWDGPTEKAGMVKLP